MGPIANRTERWTLAALLWRGHAENNCPQRGKWRTSDGVFAYWLAEHCRLQQNHNGQAALWLYAGSTLDGDRPVIGVALLSDSALAELSKALNSENGAVR